LNFTVVSPNQRTVKSLTPFSATASPLFDQSMDIPEDEEVVSPLPTIPKAHQTTCGLSRYLRRQELLIRLGDPFIQDHRGKTEKGGGGGGKWHITTIIIVTDIYRLVNGGKVITLPNPH